MRAHVLDAAHLEVEQREQRRPRKRGGGATRVSFSSERDFFIGVCRCASAATPTGHGAIAPGGGAIVTGIFGGDVGWSIAPVVTRTTRV